MNLSLAQINSSGIGCVKLIYQRVSETDPEFKDRVRAWVRAEIPDGTGYVVKYISLEEDS